MSTQNKIGRLKQQLTEAEMAVILATETPDGTNYHDNLDVIHRRDLIARKLQTAVERSRNPGIFARLSAWVAWPFTN